MYPNLNPLFLFLLSGGGGSQRRVADIFRQAFLPMSIGPGPAALLAEREFRRQQEADKTIIEEVVNDFTVKKEELPKHKALNELYTSLPEAVQASIKFPTGSP
jgi:hypothetical protein